MLAAPAESPPGNLPPACRSGVHCAARELDYSCGAELSEHVHLFECRQALTNSIIVNLCSRHIITILEFTEDPKESWDSLERKSQPLSCPQIFQFHELDQPPL